MRSKFTWIMALLMALTFNFSFAQEKTVSGTVSDDAGPLPGAGIVVKGTSRGTQTDLDGRFTISVRQGEVLEFSFLGYKTQAVTVGASNTLNIVLANETMEIDAVQLDAYRKVPVSKAPYAIATITSEAIEDRANANVLQSLQGQFAGLNIATGSGQPGADSTIILRGIGSINGTIEPLFIVDNMPVDENNFRNINPNDIASVTVLKDAAATAIYGNRGAQGVIVVYTKRGKNNEKTDFRYTTQFGFSELQPLNIDLMNSGQLLTIQKYYGQGLGSTLTDSELQALARRNNTYWADVFFRKGVTKSHDLSISSGSQNTSNFMSLNYFEQDGIFLNTNLKRFTVRNNFNGKSSDGKFTYGLNMNASFSRSNGIGGAGSNSTYFAPFTAALRGAPYLNPYNPDGSLALLGEGLIYGDDSSIVPWRAPLVLLNSVQRNTLVSDQFRMLTSFNASYEFIKNVTAAVQLGADYTHRVNKEIFHPESILGPYQVDAGARYGGFQAESTSRDFRFNSLVSLGYSNVFAEKHTVSLTGFVEYNKQHLDGINFEQRGLDPRLVGTGAAFIAGTVQEDLTPNNPNDALANPYIPTIGSTKASEGLFSYFGNLEYDYDGRFGFAATLRRDASFRFVEDNQWGTFWSVSGSWNIDRENFMKDSKVNQLRLRASYGINGNQRVVAGSYQALNLTRSLYGSGTGYNNTVSTVPTQIQNPDLRWETTAQTNFGLDFGVWNNRLSGSVDVYRKFTTDLYTDRPVSPINAITSIEANIGTMENEGIELNLRYYIVQNSDWQVLVNANGSYNRNMIRDLPDTYNGLFTQGGSGALVEGKPFGTYYVQRYAGVNPANGNPLFYTASNGLTEAISDADRVVLDKTSLPFWQGGFGTNISYKGFEFSTQWAFVADLWRNNLDLGTLEEVNTLTDNNNRATSLFNAWQNPGDVTSIPRIGNGYNSIDYINGTDRYLESGSYLRMRNVSLGYSFSKDILRDTPLTGLRFFVQGENLLTFSSYRGWDAEGGFRSTDRGQYPTPKIYTIGAVVNF